LLGKTHLLSATLLGIVLIKHFSFSLFFFSGLLLGSIFPDIDSKTSILGRKFKFLNQFMKHRGIFHSLFMLVLLYFILIIFSKRFALGFAIGFIFHLLLDIITKEGLNTLFFGKIKGPIKVGGWQENIFLIMMILITLFIVL